MRVLGGSRRARSGGAVAGRSAGEVGEAVGAWSLARSFGSSSTMGERGPPLLGRGSGTMERGEAWWGGTRADR